ncbi:AcrR family transcriptional regulator [Streptacidiphilus sp. MAP12-20]|uniref:TetR/AcrR family transcriptional regulator n=1 Tax=Streptacidiphilus sp. MAP12-20 TaxID=3156299 RepID=UPI003516A3A5
MSPRRAAVNEVMRARSRERIMQATVELIDQRGFTPVTLADIAERAQVARGLVSYYFPGKRFLLQTAMHRHMHLTLAAALRPLDDPADPAYTTDPDVWLATAIDTITGLAIDQPTLMRTHLALILAPVDGRFVQDDEQRQLGALLQEVLRRRGSPDPGVDHAVLRSALMGACIGILLPGAESPVPLIRGDLFARYGLDPRLGPRAP